MTEQEQTMLNEDYRRTKCRDAIREAIFKAMEIEKLFDIACMKYKNPYSFAEKAEYINYEINDICKNTFKEIERLSK